MEEGKEEKERKIAYLLEFVSLINCRKLGRGGHHKKEIVSWSAEKIQLWVFPPGSI